VTGFEELTMEYTIAGLIALALGAYVLYALLRPEKF
jgi:K+-transporting ATPase KdpF subunit